MSGTPWAGRRLHFIGIGGAGMSGLALVAQSLGAEVTGSDRADSSYCERLRAVGIEPHIGHDAAHLPEGAQVVVSTAIADENPELSAARDAGAPVLHRGDLLAEAASLKRCVAISGTHGKTTSAAMTAHALVACGRDPAYLIGGELRSTGSNAGWGAGEWVVVEGDESDRSFLKLAPEVAVVTNVELDHHSTYRSRHELDDAFAGFGAQSRVRWLGPEVPSPAGGAERDRRFGIEGGDLSAREVRLERLGSRFLVDDVEVVLGVPGAYNVLNALAALAASAEAGVPLAEAASAMRTFTGAKRRFERRGLTADGAEVFDDYAHHPTEVRATLEAAHTLGADRVVACFQPHLYSRTRHLAREFGRALALADLVVVLDVYPARERAEDYPGVSGLSIARTAADAAGGRPVYWAPRMDQAEAVLGAQLGPGDVLLTLGAGDVDRLAAALVEDEEEPAQREEASLPAA
jgi:UDP-N-acetylmuramate--alanine ligase